MTGTERAPGLPAAAPGRRGTGRESEVPGAPVDAGAPAYRRGVRDPAVAEGR